MKTNQIIKDIEENKKLDFKLLNEKKKKIKLLEKTINKEQLDIYKYIRQFVLDNYKLSYYKSKRIIKYFEIKYTK